MAPRAPTPPLSVAPMMDRTDRVQRRMMRHFTKRTLLYTEMVVTGAALHGDRARHLGFRPVERPLALQLGGDDPAALAACARIAEDLGYDEVNLNCGCPSDRVQQGRFGVVLMADPARVAEAVAAMRAACRLPVTVKHRLGFDDQDSPALLRAFVDTVAAAGCDRFTVHARKAWLQGLSPKENREVPPLRWDEVVALKADRPHLSIEINGGVRDLDTAVALRARGLDAVMIGRAAWDDPLLFARADTTLFGAAADPDTQPAALVDALRADVSAALAADPREKPGWLLKPWLNLFTGWPGARAWRRALTAACQLDLAGPAAWPAVRAAIDTAAAGIRGAGEDRAPIAENAAG